MTPYGQRKQLEERKRPQAPAQLQRPHHRCQLQLEG
jgi:hypothetical protein